MRVSVDTERCVGGGQCVVASPDVFDQNDDDGTVILLQPHPTANQVGSVRQAAQLCPALAISVEDDVEHLDPYTADQAQAPSPQPEEA